VPLHTIAHNDTPSILESRARLRGVLASSGVLGPGTVVGTLGPVQTPFGSAHPVEHDVVRAVEVGSPTEPTVDAAFADGMQRFSVEGWVGLAPVVRAYVGAAVLRRRDGQISPVDHHMEEFIVAPAAQLPATVVRHLEETGLPLVDCGETNRHHPMLDLHRAVDAIEARRRRAESIVADTFREQYPDEWLLVDGALPPDAASRRDARLVGVIKSHETQFLAGADLEAALTLNEGQRTTVFRRLGAKGDPVYSWYVRLWDWSGQDILYGLLRLERPELGVVIDEVGTVSRWLLAERAPVAAGDSRWDRMLYPIHEVQNYLKARAGGWH
jgi:hypothetical protein